MQELSWEKAKQVIEKNTDNKLLFLEFTTKWCGDCKMMYPVVSSVENKYSENQEIKFIKIDAEEANLFRKPDTKWQVLRVPTHILLKGQKIIAKGHEYYPKEILISWIEKGLLSIDE